MKAAILTRLVLVTVAAVSLACGQRGATSKPPVLSSQPVVHSERNAFEVGQADNGKKVELPSGSLLVLNLQNPPNWIVHVGDQRILKIAQDTHGRYPRSQGVFRGAARGSTVLEAVSDYPCMHVQPRCLMPSSAFRVTVIVVRSLDEETRGYWTPERMREAKPMPMPYPSSS